MKRLHASDGWRGPQSSPRGPGLGAEGRLECDQSTDRVVALPIEAIDPCPIQPRVNVSVELVSRLAASMQAGRHQPFLEVEPAPGRPSRYQIVCGEQRWRAARAAGLTQVLARLHPPLGYLERLEKQYEENQLRADLDPVEEAQCILLDKTLRDIAVAEQLLGDARVQFQPLDDKHITDREGFSQHLDGLKQLLVEQKVHVVRSAGRPVAGPLATWRDTERALGISEAARKAKVGILRLDPMLQEAVRGLPAEHTIQLSRLDDPRKQAELVPRVRHLTHRQVRAAVERLRKDPTLTVDAALGEPADVSNHDPLAFERQLERLADLCRQVVRNLANLRPRLVSRQRDQVIKLLAELRQALNAFEGGT